MKESLVKRTIILLAGILLTSVLFFSVATLSYSAQYRSFVLDNNRSYATQWAYSVDSRLNTTYEQLYDLLVTIYTKTSIAPGTPSIDYQTTHTLQDALAAKMMASAELTAMFILDTENDTYLYNSSAALRADINFSLKVYLQQYCLDHVTSINNHMWDVVEVLQHAYYYKSIRLGKFIAGAVIDSGIMKPFESDEFNEYAGCIRANGNLYLCAGSPQLKDSVDSNRRGDYYSSGNAVTVKQLEYSEAETVMVTRTGSTGSTSLLMLIFLIVDSGICVALIIILATYLNKNVRKPALKLADANIRLSEGNLDTRLDVEEAGSSEIETVYKSFNEMSERIEKLTITAYEDKLKREENRLKMLRAQMRPHTFLNGITTISNLTYTGKPELIREYIAAFARFTRYMLNKSNDWTTIGDELKNIDSYVVMQKIRFPDSIAISYDVPEEIQSVQIPYLIMFSLVENSFKHAMTLVDTMLITIKAERYEEDNFKGIRIIEEDNGPGFSTEALDKLLEAEADDPFTKEHLGLTNVRYSLNLIYKRDDLLRISNRPEKGARVELLIPERENEDETAGM